MVLRELDLTNFRSYHQQQFNLDPAVTIVAGPNASGKTNLLEALYVLGLMRSFRAKDQDLITHNQSHFRIVGRHTSGDMSVAFEVVPPGSHKQVKHNQTAVTQVSHLGSLPVVLFEPGHVAMVDGPPAIRRKYLDTILSQTHPSFIKQLQTYRKALQQRNRLLELRPADIKNQLFAWDIVLAEAAGEIVRLRLQLIEFLNDRITSVYEEIAGHQAGLELVYESDIDSYIYTEAFLAALAQVQPRDLAAGFTTIGPHRENVAIRFKGGQIGRVASRGEMRTVVTVLKLTEMDYIETKLKNRPLLLLDDIFSELDAARRVALVKRLGGMQTVITTTDADAIMNGLPRHVTVINAGKTANA